MMLYTTKKWLFERRQLCQKQKKKSEKEEDLLETRGPSTGKKSYGTTEF